MGRSNRYKTYEDNEQRKNTGLKGSMKRKERGDLEVSPASKGFPEAKEYIERNVQELTRSLE
ncbi:hypothetical protein ACS0TY_010169 [Phlomoides rotata]